MFNYGCGLYHFYQTDTTFLFSLQYVFFYFLVSCYYYYLGEFFKDENFYMILNYL